MCLCYLTHKTLLSFDANCTRIICRVLSMAQYWSTNTAFIMWGDLVWQLQWSAQCECTPNGSHILDRRLCRPLGTNFINIKNKLSNLHVCVWKLIHCMTFITSLQMVSITKPFWRLWTWLSLCLCRWNVSEVSIQIHLHLTIWYTGARGNYCRPLISIVRVSNP